MRITRVRIKLVQGSREHLLAFCSVLFDDAFVVDDLRVVDRAGGLFVSMPSRKLADRCPGCGVKNHLRARFCNQCGGKLDEYRAARADDGRIQLYADTAHPINAACRKLIQDAVARAYAEECALAAQPGYVCAYNDIEGSES